MLNNSNLNDLISIIMPTKFKGTSQERFAMDACLKLSRAFSSLERYLERTNVYGDLTSSQFFVLDSLYHLGQLSQKSIAEKLIKSGGNITMVIDNLEKKGFVRRVPDTSDRRVTNILLTDAGAEKIEQSLQNFVEAVVFATNDLSPIEMETLGNLCKKMGLSILSKLPGN